MDGEHEPVPGCGNEAALLLPWYVAGRLEPSEASEVEAHLAACPACREEVAFERAMVRSLPRNERVEHAPQSSLDKLLTRIDELEREVPLQASAAPVPTLAQRRTAPTRWLVAALVVQAVGLALLGSLLFGRSVTGEPAARYQTLSSVPVDAPGASVRVVFAPQTTVEQASGLLHELDARIVAGPTETGSFALALDTPSEGAVAGALARLRADGRVVFAEPIEEDSRPPR